MPVLAGPTDEQRRTPCVWLQGATSAPPNAHGGEKQGGQVSGWKVGPWHLEQLRAAPPDRDEACMRQLAQIITGTSVMARLGIGCLSVRPFVCLSLSLSLSLCPSVCHLLGFAQETLCRCVRERARTFASSCV